MKKYMLKRENFLNKTTSLMDTLACSFSIIMACFSFIWQVL